jgi:hypothetical protein
MVEKKSDNNNWKYHQGIYKHLFPSVYATREQEEKKKQESNDTNKSSDSKKEREKIIEEWQSFASGS